jgi:phenylalanine-4-hydroxylase
MPLNHFIHLFFNHFQPVPALIGFEAFFGHCPLLTNPDYAEFSQHYGRLGLAANKADRRMLARLYWFTIEFGLIETANGLRIYGSGILSSTDESYYSLESNQPVREDLVPEITSP